MVDIAPFKGIRYNPDHPDLQDEGDFSLRSLITQPYDKISPELEESYYNESPHNFVRLILNNPSLEPSGTSTDNPYRNAKELLKEWKENEIFVQDSKPAIYVYQTEFVDPAGNRRVRTGFYAMGGLEPYDTGEIQPHEYTLSEPKEDRLNLLEETRTNFEPIYMLYPEYSRRGKKVLDEVVSQEEPLYTVRTNGDQEIENEVHKVWKVQGRSEVSVLQRMLSSQTAVIADGHHRYETALEYWNSLREKAERSRGEKRERFENLAEAASRRLMVFVCMDDPGLFVYPTHRGVKSSPSVEYSTFMNDLEEDFYVRTYRSPKDSEDMQERQKREFLEDLTFEGLDSITFGMYFHDVDEFVLLILKDEDRLEEIAEEEHSAVWNQLDVNVLRKLILQKRLRISEAEIREENVLSYHRHPEELFELIDKGERKIGFFMNPTSVDEVGTVAQNGERLPQKSTDFYPKLLSGLVFSELSA